MIIRKTKKGSCDSHHARKCTTPVESIQSVHSLEGKMRIPGFMKYQILTNTMMENVNILMIIMIFERIS